VRGLSLVLGVGVEEASTGDAVEGGRGGHGVGAHVLKDEPVTNLELGEELLPGDAVHRVAGRAPEAALKLLGLGLVAEVEDLALPEDLGEDLGVVKEEAVEGAVHTVADVVHVGGLVGVVLGRDDAAGQDAGGESESGGGHIATGLGNDPHARGLGEVEVEGATEGGGNLVKGRAINPVEARVATAEVEEVGVEAHVLGDVEDVAGHLNGVGEGSGVEAAAANVEADTDDLDAEVAGELEELGGGGGRGTELDAEAADGARVVSEDTEDELGLWAVLLDLEELISVVEGHEGNVVASGVLDVVHGLAGVGEDDLGGVDAHLENGVDLFLGGTVEAEAELCERLEELRVVVALHGIEGLNPGEQLFPPVNPAHGFTEVNGVEGLSVVSMTGSAL